MRILIDTNLLVRFSDPNDQQHGIAVQALDRLAQQNHELQLIPQIIYEYWVVATRPVQNNGLGFSTPQANSFIEDMISLFPLLSDERLKFKAWMQLVLACDVQGKRAHDARLVAAMQRHSISHLLTFNGQDFARYTGISVLTPEQVVAPKK
ncbi:MAG TPA: hypothetical protein PKD64_19245 [Pirellulaceae bacterium]|nr:hypothetical protein [Pirellulaceae bacterium]HMO94327.1 hypothetical protein [Pirellulaceae bacterium]HMP71609.1 hypothetical protein [Pirellulaceae bacterium]